MGECVRNDMSLGLFLNPIVSYRTGRSQSFFNVSLLEDLTRPIGVVCPDTSEAVRLEFHSNLNHVGLFAARTSLHRSHLVRDAKKRLHVVTNLVSNDVGLGKIAGCTKA